jgi:hypothetical protein
MNTYLIGNAVRSTVRFRSPSGAFVDPAVVQVLVRIPVGTVTTYVYGVAPEVVKVNVGIYYIDMPLTAAGEWHVRWEGIGTNQAAVEHQFLCQASSF